MPAQAFVHAGTVGFGECRVDQRPVDALALQGRADLVFAPAAQPQFFAHESPGVTGIVDEAVADEFGQHPLGVAFRESPAAHQPPGVLLRFFGAGAEPHERGERLLGCLDLLFP